MFTQKMFIFNGYEIDEENKKIEFFYKIVSNNKSINFIETLMFPNATFSKIQKSLLKSLLNNLSLILGISYWKLYCPREIKIKDNFLTKEQADFWNIIYTKGLGEFFYRNKINFKNLIAFPYTDSAKQKTVEFKRKDRSLLMLGLGKDSLVSLELLKKRNKDFTTFVIVGKSIQQKLIGELGVPAIIVKRDLDQKLLKLNRQKNTYNGHVPVSAIYAFIALAAAILYDYRYIISSNEASANYGNVEYLGEVINHQWSKSLEFEQLFQDYVKTYIIRSVYYFSLLRPLHEIKIAQLFGKYPKYFSSFLSCNRNFTIKKSLDGKWCGQCPKCAFIFVTLAAFLPKKEVVKIFGKNLFADVVLLDTYKELLGIKNIKPFECVGTPEEARLAFYLVHKKGEFHNNVVMKMFEKEVLAILTNTNQLENDLLSASNEHHIPKEFRFL